MNLLITTLGTSWQIVPELLGFTNPEKYDFFCNSKAVADLRKSAKIQPVDECWIITTEGQRELAKLKIWANHWDFTIKVLICNGVNSFSDMDEIVKMRSLIYRIVLHGTEKAENLYLSLSGGRKTMSADMQEAGNLFGCNAILHVVDRNGIPDYLKESDLLTPPDAVIAEHFVPLLVSSHISPSLVVAGDKERLKAVDHPLVFSANFTTSIDEDCSLEKEIQSRKARSSQLYANFYSMISEKKNAGRDLFRMLYFLHPDILRKLRDYIIGNDTERDFRILQSLPKAELHTHLGGILLPDEIIEVAKTEKYFTADTSNSFSMEFKRKIDTILSYEGRNNDFDKFIFGEYINQEKFHGIGIDIYQKLGDYQGSSLLQTKKTICKTVEIYAKKLIQDNVKYVEIRCSPYKYTKLGLDVSQVVDCIINTMNNYTNIEYRIICIIGREAGMDSIKNNINQIIDLQDKNKKFKEKFAGIDLAGNESKGTPSALRESFMCFLENCISITIHAGETESVESIWEAVYHLSADRIGHGLNLQDKPELMRCFIDKNIGVEMCPSSNDQIVGFSASKKYPLKLYMDKGLKVSLNTDNCGISRTSLTKEFIKAAQLCQGLTLWDCIVLIRNSVSMVFTDTETKTKLMQQFEKEILEICNKELVV